MAPEIGYMSLCTYCLCSQLIPNDFFFFVEYLGKCFIVIVIVIVVVFFVFLEFLLFKLCAGCVSFYPAVNYYLMLLRSYGYLKNILGDVHCLLRG